MCYAFDLIELDGDDLRRDLLAVPQDDACQPAPTRAPGLRFNEHLDEEDGPLVFAHVCKMGLEGHRVEAQGLALSLGRLPGPSEAQAERADRYVSLYPVSCDMPGSAIRTGAADVRWGYERD
jgi:hypothetical protein